MNTKNHYRSDGVIFKNHGTRSDVTLMIPMMI
jgi:hypothetical protein